MDTLGEKYPEIEINRYLNSDPKNHELLRELLKKHDAERYIGLVPLNFIGDDFILGFDKSKIEISIQKQIEGLGPPDQDKNKITLPIIGEIYIS